MSRDTIRRVLGRPIGETAAAVLAGVLVTAVARLLVAGFLGKPAGPSDALVAGLTGGVAMAAVEWMRARRVARGWQVAVGIVAVPVVAVGWVAWVRITSGALTLGQAVYAVALAALALGALRRGARAVVEEECGVELLRLLGVGLVALWIVHPYVTERIVGGEDARWYASVFEDFLMQGRRGVFPVFVGQGENGFNGVVHLFRSAPMHLYLGGVLDGLTGRSLAPVAVQHATVVVAALAAGFGNYFGLLLLAPGARGRAALASCLYVLCPGVAATLICSDMFMTFMAVPLLPLVMIGNVRAARAENPRYGLLAVALALTWYCHPPLALWGGLISVVAQAGALAVAREPGARVRAAVPAALLFGGLTFFYFVAMSELPAVGRLPLLPGLMQLGAMVLLGAGLARWLAKGHWREWGWSAAGLAVLVGIEPAWFLWGAVTAVVVLLAALVRRREDGSSHGRFVVLAVAFAVGLAAAAWLTRDVLAGRIVEAESLRLIRAKLDLAWRPIEGVGGRRWSQFQLGWSLLAALGALVAAAFFRRRAELRWMIVPVAVLVLADFPVSGASDFFVLTFPTVLAEVLSFPVFQRELPVLAALATVGGFLAVSGEGFPSTWRRVGAVVLGVAFFWSLAESVKLVRFAQAATAGRDETAAVLRPENVRRLRHSYDLVARPRYFQDAWLDWRMESRVLDERGVVRVGPEEIAEAMEEAPAAARISFAGTPERDDPRRLVLAPTVTVPSHARILLRIAVAHEREGGRLLVTGRQAAREIFLPAVPGDGPRTHVVSLVNSGDEAEALQLVFVRARGEANVPVEDFAVATVIPYKESRHPISVASLLPYRARVRSPVAGTLELPRVFVPGYRAWVNEQEVAVRASAEHLVAVPIPAGEHQVRVAYAGTTLLWVALAASAATLLVVAGYAMRRRFAR